MRFVKTDRLIPGMVVGIGIVDVTGHTVIQKGMVLTAGFISRLDEEGYQGIYVADSLTATIEVDDYFSAYRFSLGNDAVKELRIRELQRIAINIVDDIIRRHPKRMSIQNVQSYDEYLFYHSINTTIYSTMIGLELGLDRDGLYLLAKAAILHDIGMVKVPETIRNKRQSLTNEEMQTVRNHIRETEKMLEDENLGKLIMNAILTHHENENGSGYPKGLAGMDIPDFAKIIHVADVLDAMTTKRLCKESFCTGDVLDYLASGSGILFHEVVVRAALRKFDAYPLGSEVVLSNGSHAIVSGRTADNYRPKIMLADTGERIDLFENQAYRNITIQSGSFGSSASERVTDKTGKDLSEKVRYRSPNDKQLIVVVDDIYTSRRTVEAALQNEFDVYSFDNAIDAIIFIKQNDVSLIVMDIEMPEMNGITAVKKLRAEGYADIPVIFLTAVSDRKTVMECINAGAKDYVLKPIRQIYIYERVREALNIMM